MRASEFITEAHHSILKTMTIGSWNVLIDSHAVVSMASRGVSPIDFSNIITYACIYPDIAATIPVGKGAYFQDVNTMVSIYLHRLGENQLRIETVLGPDMKPKPPMFRRPVPNTINKKVSAKFQQSQDKMAQAVQKYGRDAVSQEMSTYAPLLSMNRADRRALMRSAKRKK
jgi:hypothetical protein